MTSFLRANNGLLDWDRVRSFNSFSFFNKYNYLCIVINKFEAKVIKIAGVSLSFS